MSCVTPLNVIAANSEQCHGHGEKSRQVKRQSCRAEQNTVCEQRRHDEELLMRNSFKSRLHRNLIGHSHMMGDLQNATARPQHLQSYISMPQPYSTPRTAAPLRNRATIYPAQRVGTDFPIDITLPTACYAGIFSMKQYEKAHDSDATYRPKAASGFRPLSAHRTTSVTQQNHRHGTGGRMD